MNKAYDTNDLNSFSINASDLLGIRRKIYKPKV